MTDPIKAALEIAASNAGGFVLAILLLAAGAYYFHQHLKSLKNDIKACSDRHEACSKHTTRLERAVTILYTMQASQQGGRRKTPLPSLQELLEGTETIEPKQ